MTESVKIALAIVGDIVESEAERLESEDVASACIAVEIREAMTKIEKALKGR